MQIKLFNSLSKKKEIFVPHNERQITIYVCGPTVYDRPHIGNARSAVVYDLWFRLLSHIFSQVIYVRNITDLDDKINAAAKERAISIQNLTKEITNYYHLDMEALKVLAPTIEPRATDHIAEMIAMIEKLIAGKNAYISGANVLFDVASYKNYGELSNRALDDMIVGARVEVADYKRNPLDFVLWKPANADDDPSSVFDSPWGRGRPGWHIECSAMSNKYLGADFDIHGGGADLQFPHHENEIAQSRCAIANSHFAHYWLHNGFLTVEGEKMSKSLKNFITVRELLDKGVAGIVIRYLLLCSHYKKPLDFTWKALEQSQNAIDKFYEVISKNIENKLAAGQFFKEIIAALSDDLNSPLAFSILHKIVKEIKNSAINAKQELTSDLIASLNFLGLYDQDYLINFRKKTQQNDHKISAAEENYILEQIALRKKAKEEKNWQLADQIRQTLLDEKNVILEDRPNGATKYSKLN